MRDFSLHVNDLIGLRLTPAQLEAFELYENHLIDWNARFNLTAIDDPKKIRAKHFLDSLTCLIAMKDTSIERVIDVGTGAGFPGIPLKIVCPTMRLTLIESIGKKADFCRYIVEMLELEGVVVLQERVEVVGAMDEHRQKYDWALARAVAFMPVLMEYLLPLVRIRGRALAMKGESGPAETQHADRAMNLVGGRLTQIIPIHLPGVEDERHLVVIDKVAATPDHYPRRVGIPSKRPL